MKNVGNHPSSYGLENHGIKDAGTVHWNLSVPHLIEHALRMEDVYLAESGALVVHTGSRTGRSPKDKFIVRDESTESTVDWGAVNRPFEPEKFDALYQKVLDYIKGRTLYVLDCFAGADPKYQLPIRIITEDSWHSLFAKQLFIKPKFGSTGAHKPEFTIINVPGMMANPKTDGTNSEVFVIPNFGKGVAIIGGTGYAGEIKKTIFTVMNYLLPQRGVMSMHASANIGDNGEAALFFGLSGTGKTSLSADSSRRLIGDDEHGWSPNGLFNYEGGCYAKCIDLTEEKEPQIYRAIRYGSVVENAVFDPNTRVLDFEDGSITENTRVAYPLEFVDNAVIPSHAGHPKNVIFLTCDAFGVLPPISKLTPEQAMYHFLSGYTAKVAGTEAGVKEPEPTFSSCFGAPFMALHPAKYADLLKKYLKDYNANCWLINTGWSGGPYGVGKRMDIGYSRAMVRAVVDGKLSKIECLRDPIFKLDIPKTCPDVPDKVLIPRNTWKDPSSYDSKSKELVASFAKNFEPLASHTTEDVRKAALSL